MTQDPNPQRIDETLETTEVIDRQHIRKALADAQAEPTEAARARAFTAALSARMLMDGDLELGNAIGALIGLRQLDADALERLIVG